MGSIDVGDADALRAALDDADDPKAVKRLMVAIAYEDGVSVDTLGDRYGFPRSTIYSWLSQFESGDVADAIRDSPRPGRPRRLTDAELDELDDALAAAPAAVGLDGDEWTPSLARRYVRREFDVEYSLGHVRRLLRNRRES